MFDRITKKSFVEAMTSSSVIFCGGGFTRNRISDEEFANTVIDDCERMGVDEAEQCKCTAQSNALVRHLPNGDKSYLYFDQKCKRTFYNYGNIFVMESTYPDTERTNLVIYKCV